MGGMFIIFVFVGIGSLKSTKRIKEEAKEEKELYDEVISWAMKNISKEELDSGAEEDSEEMLYFKRTEKIRQMIEEEYEVAEEAFLDKLVDDIYEKLY